MMPTRSDLAIMGPSAMLLSARRMQMGIVTIKTGRNHGA
jgi:hypothetical protein